MSFYGIFEPVRFSFAFAVWTSLKAYCYENAISKTSSVMSSHRSCLYRKLDSANGEIRVLELSAGSGNDEIRCSFRYSSLRSPCLLRYETVSYAWGNAHERAPIKVDDFCMSVPASSVQVLRRVRNRHTTRLVWIDAICINQADNEERGQQVALMGEIYTNTVRNLIWLGEEDHDTSRAVDAMKAIRRDIDVRCQGRSDLRHILYASGSSRLVSGMGPRVSRSRLSVGIDEEALSHFYKSTWFTRLWVCQEAALPPESICYKGRIELDLRDVLLTVLWMRYKQRFLPIAWSTSTETVADLADWADRTNGAFQSMNLAVHRPGTALASVLWSLRNLDASDSRDHVYAVIGLCEAYCRTKTNIIPDYDADVAAAFRKATKVIVQHDGDLQILRDVCRRDGDDPQPLFTSWVPRYDWKRNNAAEPYRLIFAGHSADGGISMQYKDESEHLLTVRGFKADTVIRSIVAPKERDDNDALLNFLNGVESAVKNQLGGITASLWRDLGSTLRGGRKVSDKEDDGELYAEYKRLLEQQSPVVAGGMVKGSTGEGGIAAFRTALTLTCHARAFLLTVHGHLGIGPHSSQAGDTVAILYGCPLPVILRKSTAGEGEHELVGAAYIHGMMHGEAVRIYRASPHVEEVDFRVH